MNYLAIGLALIIIIIIYYVYYYFTNNTLTAGLQPLNQTVSFTHDKLKNPSSYTYSYQLWLYLSSPVSNTTKIFYRGSSGSNAYSEFELDITGTQLTLSAGSGTNGNPPVQVMNITQNFPIQKWVYLVINVYNLQTVEAYINGKLAKTVNISNSNNIIPNSKTSSLYVGDYSLNGYTTRFIRLPSTLDAKTVWNNYLSGNGLTNFFTNLFPYGINMTISSGEDIQRNVKVF